MSMTEHMSDDEYIDYLNEENARLRKALEEIEGFGTDIDGIRLIARQALEK